MTLNQITIFIRVHWRLIVLVPIISLALLFLIFIRFSSSQPSQKEIEGTPWNGIYAGATTKQELESQLGQPANTKQQNGNLIYSYNSASQYRPHQVELSQNTVSIIKEQVIANEKGKLSDYIERYGQPESKVYGQHGTFAPGHFWGQKGITVFAGEFDGTILEIWYFKPTTLEDFLSQNPELQKDEPENF